MMLIRKLKINGKPVEGNVKLTIQDGQAELTIDNSDKKKVKEQELQAFKNKWRIIMLKHIGVLLHDIVGIIENDIICKGTIGDCTIVDMYNCLDSAKTDWCITYNEKTLSVHKIFNMVFGEIDNLTGCDTKKMYHLVKTVRDLKNKFKRTDNKPHISFDKAVEQGKVEVNNKPMTTEEAYREIFKFYERR